METKPVKVPSAAKSAAKRAPARAMTEKSPLMDEVDNESTVKLPGLRARIEPNWVLTRGDGEAVDARLLPLLEAVASTGSLQQAALRLDLSYRHAWAIARPWAGQGGLLKLARGQGATLTDAGAELVKQADRARARWVSEASRWRDLELNLNASQAEKIKVYASHDLLLAEALPAFAAKQGVLMDIAIRGSTDAIAGLRSAQCEVAGFHAPADAAHPLHQQMMALVRDIPSVTCRALFGRVQGLIVERGNPYKIRSLQDLVRHHICFVNRQRGSGTRLLLDQLLVGEDISTGSIVGYGHEEFTHAAVAATVAAGAAQAGFGNEAAARLFKLDFVPLVEEHYFLAWRGSSAVLETLLAVFDQADWQERVQDMVGYRLLQTTRKRR